MTFGRRRVLAAGTALAVSTSAGAQAQAAYPDHAIRFAGGFPPGGPADLSGRMLAQSLSEVLGQQVVVENKSGAAGNIASQVVAESRPDGYTLLIGTSIMSIVPAMYDKLPYDPLNSLIAIAHFTPVPMIIVVPADGPKTIEELVALLRQEPGKHSYGSPGNGSLIHMGSLLFAQRAGGEALHVPYRGGGQAINDLIAGHIKLASLGSTPLIPHYKAGKLKLLAQSQAQRSPTLPDVPTYREGGIDLALDQWLGVFVPVGTPPAIAALLNREIGKALADPGIHKNLLDSAQEPTGGTIESFAQLVRDDYAKYGRLVKELELKTQ